MVLNSFRNTEISDISSTEECEFILKDVEDVLRQDNKEQEIQKSSWISTNNNVTRIIIIFIILILSFGLGYISNSCDIFDEEKEVMVGSNVQEMNVMIKEKEATDALNSSLHVSEDEIIVGSNEIEQEVIDKQIDMGLNEFLDQDDDKKLISGSSQSQEYPSNVILVHYHKTGEYLNFDPKPYVHVYTFCKLYTYKTF